MARPVRKHRGIFERPKGSGIWWIRYTDQFRVLHREKVGFRSAALEKYQQHKTEIRLGKFLPEQVKGKHQHSTVAELVNDYVRACEANGRKSLQDIKQRSQWWKYKFGARAARSIVKDDIETARLEL